MENASKALIMAGGILIAILGMSLFVYLIVSFGATSDKIHDQNAQTQITEFNAQFTKYQGRTNITIYDVVSVANLAIDYNKNNNTKIEVYLNNDNLTPDDNNNESNLNNNVLKKLESQVQSLVGDVDETNVKLTNYKVKKDGIEYDENGKVKKITFSK